MFWPWKWGQAKNRRHCGLASKRVVADLGLPPADLASRWTCLQLDLHDILLVYLNLQYSHLKRVRLCSSLLVRSLYTSDLCFDPGEGFTPRPVLSIQVGCSNSILFPQVLYPGGALALDENAQVMLSLGL